MKNHPETIFASSPEIMQAIRDEYPEYQAIKDLLKEIETHKGKEVSELSRVFPDVVFLSSAMATTEF